MAIDKLVAPLLRMPLFAGLKPLQLTEIARQAERIGFRPGSTITQAGAAGDGAYLIVSGEAVRIASDQRASQVIEPGSLIGELAMLAEHAYGATVLHRTLHALKITRAALPSRCRRPRLPSTSRNCWPSVCAVCRMHSSRILASRPQVAPCLTPTPSAESHDYSRPPSGVAGRPATARKRPTPGGVVRQSASCA